MNLEKAIKQKRSEYPKRMPTLTRIKVGRVLSLIAAAPLFTSWLFIFSIPMSMAISPSLWAKDKIRYFKEWRMLR
jgi:hypothetical protein